MSGCAGPEAAALIEALISYVPDTPRPQNLRESVRLSAEAGPAPATTIWRGSLAWPWQTP